MTLPEIPHWHHTAGKLKKAFGLLAVVTKPKHFTLVYRDSEYGRAVSINEGGQGSYPVPLFEAEEN